MTSHSRAHIHQLALLPGAKALILRTDPKKKGSQMEVWDLESGKRLVETSAKEPLAFELLAGNGLALSAGMEGVARLWVLPEVTLMGEVDMRAPARLGDRRRRSSDRISCMALSSGGNQILVAKGNRIALWDLESKKSGSEFGEEHHDVNALCALPDGKRLLSASSDRSLRLWEIESGKCIRVFQEDDLPAFTPRQEAQDSQSATGVCVLADGERAVSCHGDGALRCWDVETGKLLHKEQAATGDSAWMLKVSADEKGKRVLAGGFDHNVWLWELDEAPVALKGHIGEVTGVAFLQGDMRAVSCSFDQTIRVWDIDKRKSVRVIGKAKESNQWPPNKSMY